MKATVPLNSNILDPYLTSTAYMPQIERISISKAFAFYGRLIWFCANLKVFTVVKQVPVP